MSISAFDEEYAAYSTPGVLRARPIGNFAASMIGGAAVLILGAASIFVKPNSVADAVSGEPALASSQGVADAAQKIAFRPAPSAPVKQVPALDLASPEFSKEKKEFSTMSREGGGRDYVLTIGGFASRGLYLRFVFRQSGEEKPASDFFLDMGRQASQAGLAAMRIGGPSPLATRFGAFEISDIRLTQGGLETGNPTAANERACLAVRMANPKLSFEIVGLACGSAAAPIDRKSLGCIIDRLDYQGGAGNEALEQFFAKAAPSRAPNCSVTSSPSAAAKPVSSDVHPVQPAVKRSTLKR
jgi:hypothetical protein